MAGFKELLPRNPKARTTGLEGPPGLGVAAVVGCVDLAHGSGFGLQGFLGFFLFL